MHYYNLLIINFSFNFFFIIQFKVLYARTCFLFLFAEKVEKNFDAGTIYNNNYYYFENIIRIVETQCYNVVRCVSLGQAS